jgi:lipoprotein Spr
MHILRLIVLVLLVVTSSSCKQLKSLTARDTSASTKKSTSKTSIKDVIFLEDIAVTPGTKVTTKHDTKETAKKTTPQNPKPYANKPTVTYTEIDENFVDDYAVESADPLQFKYAILLDATVEKLTNTNFLKLIDYWWGTRYCLGGSTQNCIDCSAFTRIVMKDVFEADLPRTAQEQYDVTDRIEMEDLKEGDLVFFHTSGRRQITHVGVYMLNNKFVHAAASGGVMVSDLNDNYWRNAYRASGRVRKNNP